MVQVQVLSLWQPSDLLSASKGFRVKDCKDSTALLWTGLPFELQNANALSGVHLQVHPATMMLCTDGVWRHMESCSDKFRMPLRVYPHTHLLQHGNPSCLDLAKDCGLSRAGSSLRFAQGPDF